MLPDWLELFAPMAPRRKKVDEHDVMIFHVSIKSALIEQRGMVLKPLVDWVIIVQDFMLALLLCCISHLGFAYRPRPEQLPLG